MGFARTSTRLDLQSSWETFHNHTSNYLDNLSLNFSAISNMTNKMESFAVEFQRELAASRVEMKESMSNVENTIEGFETIMDNKVRLMKDRDQKQIVGLEEKVVSLQYKVAEARTTVTAQQQSKVTMDQLREPTTKTNIRLEGDILSRRAELSTFRRFATSPAVYVKNQKTRDINDDHGNEKEDSSVQIEKTNVRGWDTEAEHDGSVLMKVVVALFIILL